MDLSMNCCCRIGIEANDDHHDANDSGRQTAQSIQIGALLISGFGVRVPGSASAFLGLITLSGRIDVDLCP
jgi:hypothetical protein